MAELILQAASQYNHDGLFLITISRKQSFYEQCGFALTTRDGEGIPLSLQLEKLIGSVVAYMAVKDKLIIMQLKKSL